MAHHTGAYAGFCSMKQLGVFLLPPGWDASPSQGYPPALGTLSNRVFVDNGDVTTDKKLGLEQLQVAVATFINFPCFVMSNVKSRNYFTCKTCIAKACNCNF